MADKELQAQLRLLIDEKDLADVKSKLQEIYNAAEGDPIKLKFDIGYIESQIADVRAKLAEGFNIRFKDTLQPMIKEEVNSYMNLANAKSKNVAKSTEEKIATETLSTSIEKETSAIQKQQAVTQGALISNEQLRKSIMDTAVEMAKMGNGNIYPHILEMISAEMQKIASQSASMLSLPSKIAQEMISGQGVMRETATEAQRLGIAMQTIAEYSRNGLYANTPLIEAVSQENLVNQRIQSMRNPDAEIEWLSRLIEASAKAAEAQTQLQATVYQTQKLLTETATFKPFIEQIEEIQRISQTPMLQSASGMQSIQGFYDVLAGGQGVMRESVTDLQKLGIAMQAISDYAKNGLYKALPFSSLESTIQRLEAIMNISQTANPANLLPSMTYERASAAAEKLFGVYTNLTNGAGEVTGTTRLLNDELQRVQSIAAKDAEALQLLIDKLLNMQEIAQVKLLGAGVSPKLLGAGGLGSAINGLAAIQNNQYYSGTTANTGAASVSGTNTTSYLGMDRYLGMDQGRLSLILQISNAYNQLSSSIKNYSTFVENMDAEQKTAYSDLDKIATEIQKVGMAAMSGAGDIETLSDKFKKLNTIAGINQGVINSGKLIGMTDQQKASALSTLESRQNDVASVLKNYSAAKNGKSAASYNEIEKLAGEYNKLAQAVDNNKITNKEYQTQVNKLNKEFKQHKNVIRQAGEDTLSFGDKIKQAMAKYSYYLVSSTAIMALYSGMRQLVTGAKELNDAMTQLEIVTGGFTKSYRQMVSEYTEIAKQVGAATADIVESATAYARLGYSEEESSSLAKYTAMLKNVGDIEVGDATDAITSIVKAYGIGVDDIESSLDKLVEVGKVLPNNIVIYCKKQAITVKVGLANYIPKRPWKDLILLK